MATATLTIDPLSTSPPHTTFLSPVKSRQTRLLLLPLLPVIHLQPLPAELWARIVVLALRRGENDVRSDEDEKWRWNVARVCKWWKRVALSELYSSPYIPTIATFDSLLSHLRHTDSLWSPLHRSPYSIPAGWIRTLDLSLLPPNLTKTQILKLNNCLQSLWPMIPRLEDVTLRREWIVCAGVIKGLAENCPQLRSLRGVTWRADRSKQGEDAIVGMMRACKLLEEVHICGTGMSAPLPYPPIAYRGELLRMDHLHTLSLIGLPAAPFVAILLASPLPALRTLTVTPYTGHHGELMTPFLAAHGPKLTSLSFARGPEWPSMPIAPPSDLLVLCPDLLHLTLLHPIPPALDPPRPGKLHPLEHVCLPRPLVTLEYAAFLRYGIPYDALQGLKGVKLMEFRWLRALGRAGDTGARRGMMDIASHLKKRGVRVVDERGMGAF
ncbi:hypothetical protein DACRYDRAFT_106748 [Dacryopinax primogenitus]|uniref:F-box domain-containing protein n=1 Tax=Dacryopinax primogenitus (strain DJM 731) TaxID=1858805 RepID=M5GDU3_DACPD|nr:uncharacterized protein DACRYDRAFT_106748 [Dacryopinax primogenitus]EJU02683.1 hypothetical protein DACRYDRAFT_106748 [Dacryopinax primogenitus]